MGKADSARERDMKRRGASTPRPRTRWAVGALIVAVAVVLVVIAVRSNAPPVGHAANFAAFGLEDDPYRGDPDAPVVLVGYESPHCSACKNFHNNILPGLDERYFDTGRVVYYYIQGTLGGAQDRESNIAHECAYAHGGNEAFWSLTDRLYARSYTYTSPDWDTWLRELADEHDLDADALRTCLHDQQTLDRVNADLAVGRDHDARATPTFWAFVGDGEAVTIGSMEDVEAELQRLGAA